MKVKINGKVYGISRVYHNYNKNETELSLFEVVKMSVKSRIFEALEPLNINIAHGYSDDMILPKIITNVNKS